MKTITVVIASYYYGLFLANALDSVLSQTRMPDRILVVDDGAHDGACQIASKFSKQYPIIDFIERNTNLGIVDNFNDILMNQVKTDRVMFLGADNWLRPDYLEKTELDADIVSTDAYLAGTQVSRLVKKGSMQRRVIHSDGYYIIKYEKGGISIRNYIHGSSVYNVKMAQQFGYQYLTDGDGNIFDKTRPLEDWQLWKNMLRKAHATHIHVPEPLLYYRRHDFNFLKT